MSLANPWLLPQGIEDILPEEAHAIESLRRELLDLYQRWGYRQVITPFIEFTDSLLDEVGEDLGAQTFNLTDPISGKILGIRADITLQVARIDATRIKQQVPSRLSYIGTVLRSVSDEFASSRSPIQVGCELYGDDSIHADVEIILLMIATLRCANIQDITLDIGHVGVLRAVVSELNLSPIELERLLDILERKSIPELKDWQQQCANIDHSAQQLLGELLTLNGDISVVERARQLLGNNPQVTAALDNIAAILQQLILREPDISVHIDLADLHGYNYKTGVVFAAYVPEVGQALARGGRYDGIGAAFGNARAATGFSTHLKKLTQAGDYRHSLSMPILAPAGSDIALLAMIKDLRQSGAAVIQDCHSSIDLQRAQQLGCRAFIEATASGYQVTDLA